MLLSTDSWTSDQSRRVQKALATKMAENLKGELVMYECSLWAQSPALEGHLRQLTDKTKSKNPSQKDDVVTELKNSKPKVMASSSNNKKRDAGRRRYHQKKMSNEELRSLSEELLVDAKRKKVSNDTYKKMQTVRKRLPAHKQAGEVIEKVMKNQVVLISGETGCGKTTQIPQFIMDDYIQKGKGGDINIICTQPRRLAAIGVAERVAAEQCCHLGDTIGYQIRMDSKRSKKLDFRHDRYFVAKITR